MRFQDIILEASDLHRKLALLSIEKMKQFITFEFAYQLHFFFYQGTPFTASLRGIIRLSMEYLEKSVVGNCCIHVARRKKEN